MPAELSAVAAMTVLVLGGLAAIVASVGRASRAANAAGGRVAPRDFVGPVVLLAYALAALVLYFVVLMRGRFWIGEIPAVLAVGWWKYLGRVVPRIDPDPAAVATGVACAAAAVVAAHAVGRWVCGRWRWKWTLAAVGLVALLFAAGLAVTGLIQRTTWLLRTPEPLAKDRHRIE